MANRMRVYALVGLACAGVLVASTMVFADDPPPDAEWGDLGPITIAEILVYDVDMTMAPDDYVPINHARFLKATAFDKDCWRADENDAWHPYDDDVTSGNTETNHHMWWTVSDGKLPAMYGPSATYHAPGYSIARQLLGKGVSDVTVTVNAVDFNRGAGEQSGNKTTGFPDTQGKKSIVLKVWQIMVSKKQYGKIDDNNGAPQTPSYGDPFLGWIFPGKTETPQADGYYGNTQIKGTIPPGPNARMGYQWYQRKKGIKGYKVIGMIDWKNYYNNQTIWEPDMDPSYPGLDADPRHHITGVDVREIFANDAPGFPVGIDNNDLIEEDGMTGYQFDMRYKIWVEVDGIGGPVSNELVWRVKFTLKVQDGVWYALDSHIPQ